MTASTGAPQSWGMWWACSSLVAEVPSWLAGKVPVFVVSTGFTVWHRGVLRDPRQDSVVQTAQGALLRRARQATAAPAWLRGGLTGVVSCCVVQAFQLTPRVPPVRTCVTCK
jgi:hypothetical protein